MEETNDVQLDSSPVVSEDLQTPAQETPVLGEPESEAAKPPKGFVPYEALEQERTKRKELERKNRELETPKETSFVSADGEYVSRKDFMALQDSLKEIQKKEEMRELFAEFPQIADSKKDFMEFLEDEENKRISLKKAAKLYMVDKGLITPDAPRKGLERPSGTTTGKMPTVSVSTEDIQRLRINNPKKYQQMIVEGKIRPEFIK